MVFVVRCNSSSVNGYLKNTSEISKVLESLNEKYGEKNEVLAELQKQLYKVVPETADYIVKIKPGFEKAVEEGISFEEIKKQFDAIFEEDIQKTSSLITEGSIFDIIKNAWNKIKSIFSNIISKFINKVDETNKAVETDLNKLEQLV